MGGIRDWLRYNFHAVGCVENVSLNISIVLFLFDCFRCVLVLVQMLVLVQQTLRQQTNSVVGRGGFSRQVATAHSNFESLPCSLTLRECLRGTRVTHKPYQ